MQRVRRQLTKTPELAAAHFLEARVLAAQGNWELATPALFKTLELDSDYTPAYDLLSNALAVQKPSAQISERVETLVAKNPGNMRAALIAGNLLVNSRKIDQARDVYEKHLSARPESAPVLNNLAVLYLDNLNQPERALELARKARKLEPTSPAIADTLGWVLFNRKEYAEALELFKESAAKFPKVGEIQYHLGLANQALGHTEAARAAFQAAAQAPEKFPGKEDVAQKLAELGGAAAETAGASPREAKTK
jgi:tetratricopeptide (TPR) repeat protein